MAILINCSNCGAEIYKSPCFLKRSKNLFCGNACRIEYMKGKGIGKENPNFGKKWDSDRKKKQSEVIKSKVNDEYRINCSKGMKDKEVKDETKRKRKETMMKRYGKLSPIKDIGHSEESRKKIGEKSKQKFTPEFKKDHYRKMVDSGVWIEKEKKNPYYFYRDLANWNYNVLSFGVIGYEKAIEFGFYNHKSNREGLVRDHRYSRMSGFKELVFPEILRHPFNCEFIKLEENAIKHHKKSISSDSITLEELFEGIKNYKKEYTEQSICLEKIKQYEMGLRYDPNDYFKNY